MARLKTFVVESGFYELAVAATSQKAALEAWGMSQNAFAQGFARQSKEADIVAAAEAAPGTVLRRPLGGKGPFKAKPEAPRVKATPKKARKRKKAPDARRIRAAQAALDRAEAAHTARLEKLRKQRDAIDEAVAKAEDEWDAMREKLARALQAAKRG